MEAYLNKPILCLDFDGVIHSYISGWQGVDVANDPPVPGVFDWLERAVQHFTVYVYSSRSSSPMGRHAMIKYIEPYVNTDIMNQLAFTDEKPRAFLTIDDRCIQFNGNWWDPTLDPEILLRYQPWNKR